MAEGRRNEMKYIRTKDGRIIDVSLFDEYQTTNERDESVFDGFGCGNGKVYFPAEDILKEANFIEELCDYCIYRNCEGELIIRKIPLSSSWKSLVRSMKYGMIFDIKLAIITGKGLIYVAKMNEEGELELL